MYALAKMPKRVLVLATSEFPVERPVRSPRNPSGTVIVVAAAAEHDRVIDAPFQERQRPECNHLAGEPRPRERSSRVELTEERLIPIQPQITQNAGQMARMNILDAQGRERQRVIGLRKLVVMPDPP